MYKGERFNSISHLIGAVAAIAGLAILVVIAAKQGDPWKIVSFSIYGFTLLLLFIFSTIYHSLRGKAKEVFRALDHISIYLLIAGTYTPLTLVTLRGAWGWSIFGIVWGLAVLGIILDSLPQEGAQDIACGDLSAYGLDHHDCPQAVAEAFASCGICLAPCRRSFLYCRRDLLRSG